MGGWSLASSLFLLPALFLLAVFLIYPVIFTIRLSLDTGRGFEFTRFVGLDNFVRLFTRDRNFLDIREFPPSGAIFNNVLWLLLYTSLCIGLGLIIAVLASRVRYEAFIKAVVFLPMAISATAMGIIWRFVYAPDAETGLVNAGLGIFGIDPISWLGRPETVNFAIIIAGVWGSVGFATVIFSAALKGIPTEIVEAARVDGATEGQIFRRILIPMISLPISVVAVTLVINVINVFDIIYVMSGGGPRHSSDVMAFTMFQKTFAEGNAGQGAAVAVVMLLLLIPIMIFNVRRFRSEAVT